MYRFKLSAILVCFTLVVIAVAASGSGAYAAGQNKPDIVFQQATDLRKKVETMMQRGKQYDSDIAKMTVQRDQIIEIIDVSNEETKRLVTEYEKLSNALQKINFDKELTHSQWRDLSQQVRDRMDVVTQRQAKVSNRLKIKTAELAELQKELKDTIKHAKKLDKEREIAFHEWEVAEEYAKAMLNSTEPAAGGR